MSAITLNQLSSLQTVESSQLNNIKGGWIFSFGYSPTKVTNTTTLQNVFSGGSAPNLKYQVVATTGAGVNIFEGGVPVGLPQPQPQPQ